MVGTDYLFEPTNMTVYGEDQDGNPVTVEVRCAIGYQGSHAAVLVAREQYPDYTWNTAVASPHIIMWGRSWVARTARHVLKWYEANRSLQGVERVA